MEHPFQRKQQLLHLYHALQQDMDDIICAEIQSALQQQQRHLEQEQFQVAFIGRFSVGKSYLINRLFLGANVLPTCISPTTARSLHIVYGDRKGLQQIVMDQDGRLTGRELARSDDDQVIHDAIEQHTTHQGQVDCCDEQSAFQLTWPDQQLLRHGVVLCDTIGTESINDQFINQTYDAIDQSAAVVFLTHIRQPLTLDESELIARHFEESGKKLFWVVTKADQLSDQEQQEVMTDLQQRLQSFFKTHHIRNDERLMAVSAKTGQNIDGLRQNLIRFVVQDRMTELLQLHARQLLEKVDRCLQQITQQLSRLETIKKGEQRQIQQLQEQMKALQNDLRQQSDGLQAIQDDITHSARHDLQLALQQIRTGLQKELVDGVLNKLSNRNLATRAINDVRIRVTAIEYQIEMEIKHGLQQQLHHLCPTIDLGQLSTIPVGKEAGAGGAVIGSLLGVTGAGTAVAAAMLTVPAIPVVAAGLALALLGKWLFGHSRAKQIHDRYRLIDVLIDQYQQEISTNIAATVAQTMQQQLAWMQQQVDRQIVELQQLIDQKDMALIDQQIDRARQTCRRLSDYPHQIRAMMT
ncbi:MAG: dynamin family protein [Magnetococcales bacterium]|nr:dynamin family protein [Magnetococcales bacterium]